MCVPVRTQTRARGSAEEGLRLSAAGLSLTYGGFCPKTSRCLRRAITGWTCEGDVSAVGAAVPSQREGVLLGGGLVLAGQ